MARWGMVINLHTCIGCYNCMISCKQEHFLPPNIFFSRVLVGEMGIYPSVIKLVYPVLCNHCDDPSCVDVCPFGATEKREDGIVTVDSEACIGCRSCLMACPYQQRSYLAKADEVYFPGQGLTPYEEMGRELSPKEKGTVVKCNFCTHRLEKRQNPACVDTCPALARTFGDLDDPQSEVSRLIVLHRGAPFREELGTEPSVYYIKG